MKFIDSPSTDPYFNLALEEYVFEKLDRNNSFFMLWQNYNTIVVGKYQNTAEEINREYVQEHKIKVVRRLSGGGAVYHDRGNLNFTFIVDSKDSDDFNFKLFVDPVVRALKRFGVNAEFNGRNDITIDGKKFSGNSQYMRRGRLLHHGCIMLDSNLTNVADALRVKEAKFESKAVKSVKSRVTTINACAPSPISMEDFRNALKEEAQRGGEMETYNLSKEDIDAVNILKEEKYMTDEWNYGFVSEYNMRSEKKFPAGLVSAYLSAGNGHINSIRFYGDFFGNGDLSELESNMRGLSLDDSLTAELEKLNISYYMNGITAKDIKGLLI